MTNKPNKKNECAVVIGGSIAGLAAARVLAKHFEKVVVIERDARPEGPNPRKGAPQGWHGHALLKSGEQAMEQLFPGVVDDLMENGAHKIDFSEDTKWFHFGRWKMRYPSDFSIMFQSRPLVEHVIRKRVEALTNVTFHYGHAAEALITSEDKSHVIGLYAEDAENRSKQLCVSADLVVDASGRGSKVPQWLEKLNYARPEQTVVKIDLSYSSRVFEAPSAPLGDWKALVLNPLLGKSMRAGYVFPLENNQVLITLAGYSGDRSPQTNETFLEYAQGLAMPDVYNVIKALKPLTDVKSYSVPIIHRNHYEKLKHLPAGLVVMGDAFCGFDPVFGQGMSVAVREAVILDQMLTQGSISQSTRFVRQFYAGIAKALAAPWMLTSSEDFRLPKTEGKRSFILPLLHWYSGRVFLLSASDKEVYSAFRDVMHMLRGPAHLFKPSIIAKVLFAPSGVQQTDIHVSDVLTHRAHS